MITIDGVSYDSTVVCDSLEQKFEKLSSDKSGRTQAGDMFIDPIGTFYNYTIHIKRNPNASATAWDNLWMVLSDPKGFHTVEFPHNQTVLTFQAYITSGSRKLLRKVRSLNYWGDISFTFTARSPQRRA